MSDPEPDYATLMTPVDTNGLVDHLRHVEHHKNKLLMAATAAFAVALGLLAVLIIRFHHDLNVVKKLGTENHQILTEKNSTLQAQVDSARDLLTQLYTALNDSQKQVIDLGGVPKHFEFTVPTTVPSPATSQPPAGAPATTTGPPPTDSAVSGASEGTMSVALDDTAVLAIVFTPMLVPALLPTTTDVVPPTTTEVPPVVPDVTLPPVTVPLPTDTTLPPPFGLGSATTTTVPAEPPDTTVLVDTSLPG